MRIAFYSIMVGISTAMGLKNEKNPSSSVVTISIVSEIATILIFGLSELS